MLQRFSPADLLRGLSYPFRGYRVLRQHPGLARYWVMPMVLTSLALLASVWLTLTYADDLLALFWQPPTVGSGWHWLYTTVYALWFVLALALMVLACVLSSGVIAAPFNDLLSEAIEERVTARPAPRFSLGRFLEELLRTVSLALTRLLLYGAVVGPLWLLSWLVPGLGHAIYLVIWTLFTAAYFALDYVDWPAARHGLSIRARFGLLRERPLLMLGFGLSVWLCLFVPLLNLIFMPLSVAGGTLLYLDMQAGIPRASSRTR
jgi:CysZ protein